MKPDARILVRLFVPAAALLLAALAVVAPAGAARAKVAEVSDRGFIVRHVVEVPAGVEETWAMLLKPAEWWDSSHTWSGDAANMSIDPRAGGCFCEVLPNPASPRAAPRGSAQHMRVIYIERPRVLRMAGALGPLQADAVNGTLTVQLKAGAAGSDKTQILLEYVVGGYARAPFAQLAPAVDGVLGEQMKHLAAKLGGAFAAAFSLPAGDGAEPPPAPEDGPLPESEPLPGVLPLAEEPIKPAAKPLGR